MLVFSGVKLQKRGGSCVLLGVENTIRLGEVKPNWVELFVKL